MKIDRLNLVVLILFPILTLGAIKLTNLVLPAKYYFSLSKLAKGADEPFIVDPPSVTEAKFCDLLKKYEVQSSDVGLPHIDCENLDNASQQTVTAYMPTSDERDLIYRIAFENDQRAVAALAADLNSMPRQPIAQDQLDSILNSSRSVMAAYHSLASAYSNQISGLPYNQASQLKTFSETAFKPVINQAGGNNNNFQQTDFNEPAQPSLKPEEMAKILQAHQNFVNAYSSGDVPGSVKHIAASDIEQILKNVYSADNIPNSFAQFYASQAGDAVTELMKTKFIEANLNIGNADQVRQEILSDVSQTGILNYIISALARVAPIFLVAIIFGLYFGRREIMSISIASAALAFLLVWPIILLWNTVVQSQWAAYREIFLGIYLLYVVVFFTVARFGALVGAYFGDRLKWHKPQGETAGPDGEIIPAKGYGREIFVSMIASTIFSLVAFSMNLILPLST